MTEETKRDSDSTAASSKTEVVSGPRDEEQECSSIRYTVQTTPHFGMWLDLKDILVTEKSDFQTVRVAETEEFGRCLILDGQIQSAERDEHCYHEALVHPALLTHPNPQRVFIGGGGELATAREVMKHPSVKLCRMVDIDECVVRVSKEHLPSMVGGVTEDSRLEVRIGDAVAALKESQKTGEKWDVIIMDIADPIEAGPGIVCYFQSFYRMLWEVLSEDGVLVSQSGPGGFIGHSECSTVINRTLQSVFPKVHLFTSEVPSFEQPWAFNLAVKKPTSSPILFVTDRSHPNRKSVVDSVNDELTQRFGDQKTCDALLKMYDGESHAKMFCLPKAQRDTLAKETRIMTEDSPVFMHG